LDQLEQYGASAFVIKSVHLVKSMTDVLGNNTTFAYTFDKTGKITAIQMSGALTEEIDIVYACQN